MLIQRKTSRPSSKKSSNSYSVDFNVLYIVNNRNNIPKNQDEVIKDKQLILISETDKPEELLDTKIKSSNVKKKEEKIKNSIDVQKNEKHLNIIDLKRGEIVNSSNILNKNDEIIHKSHNKVFSYMRRSLSSNSDNYSENEKSYDDINKICSICRQKLTEEEKRDNLIKCYHLFCNDCYYEFLKEKINSNFVEGIKCMQKDCDSKLYDNFIQKKLLRDIPLLDKYKRLDTKRQLMLNPNIQLCPYTDCDSYALKIGNNKYVSCKKNNHKFCFNCLKEWHGDKECDNSVDKSFQNWRDFNKVKRCPKCKYFIEKDEGCNHITCYNCRYQFCWLCMGEYTSGHYDLGRCTGLQYTDCNICSNRIINFLYQLLLVTLKCLLFAIALPFLFVFFFSYTFSEKIADLDCINILNGIIGCISGLKFIILLIPITSLIALLMFFYWPLQDIIFGLAEKF